MKLILSIGLLLMVSHLTASNIDIDPAAKKRLKQSAVQFFESTELINISVEADFSSIRADRDRTQNEYHPAKLVWNDNGALNDIPLKIKTRGNFRLKSENCDFPPLRFKFKTNDVLNTVFEGQKKLKLVTHCRDASEDMQQTMLREFLVYKMYNAVSENSLRVRLVNITYVDVATGEAINKYAFFIESVEQMAKRMGYEEVEMANIKQEQLLERNVIHLALFNYMIGNTDWSVPKLHNVALLQKERHSPPIAVPFDFDMSEFADACYMKVYMGRELLENRYKGKRISAESLAEVTDYYQSKKDKLLNVVEKTVKLTTQGRNKMTIAASLN